MNFLGLCLGILATWRITHLLNEEDGPFRAFRRFRQWLGHGHVAEMVNCFYCLSLWIAIPFAFALGVGVRERVLGWLAFSAGAIFLERVTSREDVPAAEPAEAGSGVQSAEYIEDTPAGPPASH